MIYQYVVTLRNKSRRYIDRLSFLLLVISVILFCREQLISPNVRIPWLFGGIAILAIIARNIYLIRKKQEAVNYNNALFIAAIGWVTMPYLFWLFIPFALMGLFEKQAKRPLEIGFSDSAIVVNSLFRRRYNWNDLNNVVLKDDMLTLDFKNNRLLQRETIDEEADAGEDEFNEYCRHRLEAAKAETILS